MEISDWLAPNDALRVDRPKSIAILQRLRFPEDRANCNAVISIAFFAASGLDFPGCHIPPKR
jgi:hypothetical protein